MDNQNDKKYENLTEKFSTEYSDFTKLSNERFDYFFENYLKNWK
jgi:hypothetical protein